MGYVCKWICDNFIDNWVNIRAFNVQRLQIGRRVSGSVLTQRLLLSNLRSRKWNDWILYGLSVSKQRRRSNGEMAAIGLPLVNVNFICISIRAYVAVLRYPRFISLSLLFFPSDKPREKAETVNWKLISFVRKTRYFICTCNNQRCSILKYNLKCNNLLK
jgi:hypothetical protein